MSPFFSPSEALRLSIRTAMMLHEAQMVMGMRFLGMAGLWSVRPFEQRRMVTEKLDALRDSGIATSRAVMSGKRPVEVAEAALAPVARRTRSNVTRLGRAPRKKPGAGL